MIIEFDDAGERFVSEASKRLGRSQEDTVKCSVALLYWIIESVVKEGRTITLLDGSFDPYEGIIVAPGDKTKRPLAKMFKFPVPEPEKK